MEKKTGRVHNFLVANVREFTDCLAMKLCKNQIQYVQIDNEFHFNDHIYRFFGLKDVINISSVLEDCLGNTVIVGTSDLIHTNDAESLVGVLNSDNQESDYYENEENRSRQRFAYVKKRKHSDRNLINLTLKQNYYHENNAKKHYGHRF